MSFLQITSLLIVLAAGFSVINALVLRLVPSIGILSVTLASSFVLLGLDAAFPVLGLATEAHAFVSQIEFPKALLEGMLGLLLFGGALGVRVQDLRGEWPVVFLLATVAVAISTAIIGIGFHFLVGAPLLVALVFGALISPTDPVAVMGTLRQAGLSRPLEVQIEGESLFNDGIGYVVFLILSGLAFSTSQHSGVDLQGVAILFLREAVGGALLGLVLGWIAFRTIRLIDDYGTEVLITLGLALGGYQLAISLSVSAAMMAVCAGLLVGEIGKRHGMSDTTEKYVTAFWLLVNHILNALLFLMIGLEVFALQVTLDVVMIGTLAIGLSLVGRLISVSTSLVLLRWLRTFPPGISRLLTWGGVKGGISVALALSLPDNAWKGEILTITFIVVVFSVLVQGLTVERVARRFSLLKPDG